MDNLGLHANNIRKNIVKMVANAKSGHPGGSL
ncbi:MAG: transketolase, partial [Erysipelotrichaceae bacterium]|nr:transketolase [Erysipelotrichaceae bacterium]